MFDNYIFTVYNQRVNLQKENKNATKFFGDLQETTV